MDNGMPIEDPQQDCELLESSQMNGVTTIVFKRRWETGDNEHDVNLLKVRFSFN